MMKQRLYQRWGEYSTREKALLVLLTMAGTLVLIWFGLLSPLMEYQQKGKEKMNKEATDYVWIADNVAQFDFAASETAGSLTQQVTQALEEYKLNLAIGAADEQQLELITPDAPVAFLPLMRLLIYIQASHNIIVSKIDLIAIKDNDDLVYINKLILSRDGKHMLNAGKTAGGK